jgi:hypothetical protein
VCHQICSSEKEVGEQFAKLKLIPCPHCKVTGTLIRHGFLRGFAENHLSHKIVRATRVFCSNRHAQGSGRTTGCGRTFSIWIANRIKHLFLSADRVWQFLSKVADSGNIRQAFRDLRCGLSDSAAYHLWRRFLNAQATVRTALTAICPPPPSESNRPAQLTLAHLKQAFKHHPLSPIAAFAQTLQTFFL